MGFGICPLELVSSILYIYSVLANVKIYRETVLDLVRVGKNTCKDSRPLIGLITKLSHAFVLASLVLIPFKLLLSLNYALT